MKGGLEKLATFLGYELPDDKKDQLLEHLGINNFRTNKAVNNEFLLKKDRSYDFIRKGVVGDYKNWFTDEKVKEWNQWVDESIQDVELKAKLMRGE